MRTPCSRILVPILVAIAVARVACAAEPTGAPAPADEARWNEQYVILPGAEPLFSDMLGSGQTLPGGCSFRAGQIERTSVVATYTCGAESVVLELLHPEVAPAGGVRTRRFAITVKSGAPPAGLMEAVADRIRAREAAFEWAVAPGFARRSQQNPAGRSPRTMILAFPVVVGLLVVWALWRRIARRRGL